MLEDILVDTTYLIKFIVEGICLVTLTIFLGIIKKRTKYGTEMLGKILGFKQFLEIAEKPKIVKNFKNTCYFSIFLLLYLGSINAGVAELADAQDSKSCEVTFVWVRPPPPAPQKISRFL